MKYRTCLLISLSTIAATSLAWGCKNAEPDVVIKETPVPVTPVPTTPAQAPSGDGVVFKRPFQPGTVSEFELKMSFAQMNIGMTYVVRETVQKPSMDGVNQVLYETLRTAATGGPEAKPTPPPIPAPLKTPVTANSMGDDIHMTMGATDFDYYFVAMAGITPDKKVSAGDEFPINWSSKKQASTFTGKGKIISVMGKEIKEDINVAMTIDGKPFGNMHWVSTFRTDDFSLVSATGMWEMQGLKWAETIRRLPAGS